jgi:hypothetical protein
MEHSRRHQSSENYKAVPLIAEKLLPIWQHYPLMVTAASCLYCGNTTRVLSELINTKTVMDERIIALSMTHPRLLRDIAPLGVISPEKLNTVTAVHAEFFSGGDSGTSIFIANALIAQQDYQRLRLWVSKGLNGGRALNQTDLSTIPFDIVVAAWQQGARQGYDQASLTRYLVAQGYRPALRWLVWLQGSEMKYLHTWGYQRQAEEYKKVLIDYTSFAIHEPNALALFYSKNWRNIHWDKEQQRWLF